MSDDLIIDANNFDEYFFDVKKYGPKQGQIMARYVTRAELVAGDEKSYLIDLLVTNPMGAEMGVQLATGMFYAQESEAIRVCKAVTLDLLEGKSKQEVMNKPYSYTVERFFWTKEEYVPKDDPHWKAIKVTLMNTEPEKNEDE